MRSRFKEQKEPERPTTPSRHSIPVSLTQYEEIRDAPWTHAGEILAANMAADAKNESDLFTEAQMTFLYRANVMDFVLIVIPVIVGGITGVAALVDGPTAAQVALMTSTLGSALQALAAGYNKANDFHGKQERFATHAVQCGNFAQRIKTVLEGFSRKHRPPFGSCISAWSQRWNELMVHRPEFTSGEMKFCPINRNSWQDYITLFRAHEDDSQSFSQVAPNSYPEDIVVAINTTHSSKPD